MLQTVESTQGMAPIVALEPRLPLAAPPRRDVEDADLRRALRAQVARLERRLGALAGELGRAGRAQPLPAVAAGAAGLGPAPGAARLASTGPHLASGGPRLLGLAELERARDELVGHLRAAERLLVGRDADEAAARARVEAMLADPAAHRWARVRREELGEPGCGAWEVRPRAGLLGMLLHWWRVKLSSGCP